jgi:RNase P/RNase MRP subunit p29
MSSDGSFFFPLRLAPKSAYGVSIQAQPAGLTCRVTNATGTTASSDISTVQVTCVPNSTLGGTVTNLTANGLVLVNGNDRVSVAANQTTFEFPSKVGNGFAYGVTVLTQPAPQSCAVQNGAGIASGNVTTVQVICQ